MKHIIALILICFSLSGFAQTEKKVEKNDEKIDELNKRLDNLLGTSKSIVGDSVDYKLDLIFREIQELKTEMQFIRKSLEEIQTEGVSYSNKSKLDALNTKIQDIENGEYYVVIASALESNRANSLLTRYSKNYSVSLVRNLRESWYHIILNQPMSMKAAIKKTLDLKNGGIFTDAWWLAGKKIKSI